MKHMSYVVSILLLVLFACKKPTEVNNNNDPYQDAPRSEMPAEIAPAQWRYGSLSALGLYNDRGDFIANSEEALREYSVTKDGYVEFVQYLAVAGSGCYSMTYTHLKGTMKFEAPNKITWTPVEGDFYKKFSCSDVEDSRKAEQADLDRSKDVFWYKWDDFGIIGGKKYLVLFTDPSMLPQYKVFAYDVIK